MTDERPICVSCQLSMKCEKNGVKVKYSTNEAQNGDLYQCPMCGNQVIVGFGAKYWDHHPDAYDYIRNT